MPEQKFPVLDRHNLMHLDSTLLSVVVTEANALIRLRKINSFTAWAEVYSPKTTQKEIEQLFA